MFDKFFRRNKKKKLYFALVVSDSPADGFKFTPDKECRVFLFNGEVDPEVVIPKTTLKAAVDKFDLAVPEEEVEEPKNVKIIERKV